MFPEVNKPVFTIKNELMYTASLTKEGFMYFCCYRAGPDGWFCFSEDMMGWDSQLLDLMNGISKNGWAVVADDFEFLQLRGGKTKFLLSRYVVSR